MDNVLTLQLLGEDEGQAAGCIDFSNMSCTSWISCMSYVSTARQQDLFGEW